MIKNTHKSPKLIPPQKHLIPCSSNKKIRMVNEEYQITMSASGKNSQNSNDKCNQYKQVGKNERLLVRRRLSFKKNDSKDKATINSATKEKSDIKRSQEIVVNKDLAYQIEYNQFPVGGGEAKKELISDTKRRIRRIRSSSNLSRQNTMFPMEKQFIVKLNEVKKENTRLKELKLRSSMKLDGLQQQFSRQKRQFQSQIICYQRKIEALRRKIQMNKNEFGHLFAYEAFDPNKFLVQPIVEVEGETSQFQSMVKQSDIKELNFQSRVRLDQLINSDMKQKLTETTRAASREECGQLDYF